MDADGADDFGNTLLQERDSRVAAEGPVSGKENEEYGRGADQQGIDVDRNDLSQALLGGVGDGSRCAGIGGRAHACLIGEEAAFDAQDHAGAGKASENCLEIKSVRHDDSQHSGNPGDVGDDDKDADQDVEACHDRHQDRGNLADDVTHKEDHQGPDRKDDADHSGQNTGRKILHIDIKGRDDVVGLQSVEAEGKGGNQGDCEDNAQPAGMKGTLNIVGGTALEGIPFFLFINLGKCTLDEGGRRSQDRHQPHPEGRAGAAHNDGGSDARHVARADTGGSSDHQRLEGGDALVALFLLHHAVHGVLKAPDLDEAGADGKIDAAPGQQIDQQPGI